MNDGRIVLRFNNKEQMNKVTNKLERGQNIEIKERGHNKPRFIVIQVTKSYIEEELKDMIVTENKNIENRLATKVVYKKNCRNPNEENIIFEAITEIFKYMVKEQKLSHNVR